jgi:hypothetical protein
MAALLFCGMNLTGKREAPGAIETKNASAKASFPSHSLRLRPIGKSK